MFLLAPFVLQCDSHVPLSLSGSLPDVDEQYKGIEAYLTPALLTKLRMYLTLTSMLPYSLPEDLQKVNNQKQLTNDVDFFIIAASKYCQHCF